MLMPTCTSVSSRRSSRGPSSASAGCRCGALCCVTKAKRKKLAVRIKRTRAAMVERLELVRRPELSILSDAERSQLLVALDILTDFESWGRLREGHGLSIEAARDVWMGAIGRMLPTVNQKSANPSNGAFARTDQIETNRPTL